MPVGHDHANSRAQLALKAGCMGGLCSSDPDCSWQADVMRVLHWLSVQVHMQHEL